MVTPELQLDVERFLFREARLLDDARYDDWLALLTDDVRYWMPVRETTSDHGEAIRRLGEMAVFEDDKDFLKARVQRLHTGLAHAETPPSRTRHLLSNFEIEERSDGEVEVGCNMLVYQTRLERTEAFYVGRREDRLRRTGDGWRIAARKIVLDQTLMPRTISILF
ncbi:MAG: 3-phenylpropionate/cinnamic acid dioxygenase subunit beta [Planctomycetia bacterium]|nr:3-phenylpropionate/cinnamic acid dioxygenase subunit beta [Planctomycetia bacterium]